MTQPNTDTLPKARLIDIQQHEDRVARSARNQGYAEGLIAAAGVVLPIIDNEAGRKVRRAILDLIREEDRK